MIRPLHPDDVPALDRMLARCSPESIWLRFRGRPNGFPSSYLQRCLTGEQTALVDEQEGEVVAMGSIGPVPGEPGVAEMAVLVEDRWQHLGLGRRLMLALLVQAGPRVVRMHMVRSSLSAHLATTLRVLAVERHGSETVLDVDARSAVEHWSERRRDRGERGDVLVQPG
ncbi:GNAT family N-acetyltransferase [Pseudonocardia thermophila]|uniref:GNAT family N-acetyltransferase n=1 Tax=Pseudonocardia thermophila TaxID=1848 RepID=UPI00248F04CA|nr:GNAT family N-acetyltransferase [Pseudonocardia thermophila]